VTETTTIQGRSIGPVQLSEVRALLQAHPHWSRYQLSRQLATLWNWRNPVGQLKDMAARTLLLKLAQRGWIRLPPCRWASPNRMRHKPAPRWTEPVCEVPIATSLAALRPLSIREVSPPEGGALRVLWEALLHRYHYLSYRSPVGENLQYLVSDRTGRPLACLLFGAAAWQCRARDEHIGWNAATRQRHLGAIANNARFLVLPWLQVPGLASHLLSVVAGRVARDWQRKYGHPVLLLESFVDTSRFQGVCYQAANWTYVGNTTGRTRQNKSAIPQAPPKAVWLYPLRADWRRHLLAL
jgi:hypothetical protein